MEIDLEQIGLEPSTSEIFAFLQSEKYKYNVTTGTWSKSRSSKSYNKLEVANNVAPTFAQRYDSTTILNAIGKIEANWSDIQSLIYEQKTGAISQSRSWLERWKELVKQRFSAVDNEIWDGVRYTSNNEGQTFIITPTGNGNEYCTVGCTVDEVYNYFKSLQMPNRKLSRLQYIEQKIVDTIIDQTIGMLPGETTPIEQIDGSKLSAAAAGKMYNYQVVKQENEIKGFALTASVKDLTVYNYVYCSYEALVCRPEKAIDEIQSISNDEDEPCYRYIDLDFEAGYYPYWAEWMRSTLGDKDKISIFMAWIASVLISNNNGKQALYMHGRGNDAKSVIANVLTDYLQEAATSINKNSMSNQFGLSKLENKRLVVMADNKNPKIMHTEWVHNLTGGDSVDVERKQKQSYSDQLFGKLMIMSNIPPEIKIDERNQVSRLIYLRLISRSNEYLAEQGLGSFDGEGNFCFYGDSSFKDNLYAELEYFFHDCLRVYKHICPTDSELPIPSGMMQELENTCADPTSAGLMDFLADHFVMVPDGFVSSKDLVETCKLELEDYGVSYNNNFVLSDIYSTLYNNYGAIKQVKRKDGKCIRGVKGVMLKEEYDKQQKQSSHEDSPF
jgi:hypothetical protein